MREFLACRTWKQWAVFAIWAALIVVICIGDAKAGKPILAIVELTAYSSLFIAAAFAGRKRLFG